MSYASERPQDFVVPILTVRAFRLAICSVRLALSGYTDSTPNLDRTIFEISIRLLDMGKDPVAASLGYLIQGSLEELSTARVEFNYRKDQQLESHNMHRNIQALESHLDSLYETTRKRGYDPEEIRKKYGKTNVREVCKRYGIEKAYLVDFAHYSSHVHEKNVATNLFASESPSTRDFAMGPIPNAIPHCIADALTNLIRVIEFGCVLVEDEKLISRAQKVGTQLTERITALGMGDTPINRQNNGVM